MTEPTVTSRSSTDVLSAELTERLGRFVEACLVRDDERLQRDFEHLLGRSQDLAARKMSMQGTKGETRDLVGEVLFSRLRRALRSFLESGDAEDEIKVAEWALSALFGTATLTEFAGAVDAAILAGTGPQDYSFAGRCDFIALEEVLQMLGTGKHCGCLSLEGQDNRLDIYIQGGQVRFLDPHHLIRRVLPGVTPMQYREIPDQVMELAERRHAMEGVPVVLTLREAGILHGLDERGIMAQLGSEVLFDFLCDQEQTRFVYRRFDSLPEHVKEFDLRIGITPVLLELSKRLDDWRGVQRAFPDSLQPVQPLPDMLVRISELNLSVLEIKVLTMINGENAPADIAGTTGLPLLDVYRLLVRFAAEGAIETPGGSASLLDLDFDEEDSVESALEALDANDDHNAVSSVLDRVLGGDDGDGFSF